MYDDALRQDELHWKFHLLHRRTDGVSALTLSTINQSSINSSHPTKLHTALSLPYFAVTPAHLLAARYLVLFFFSEPLLHDSFTRSCLCLSLQSVWHAADTTNRRLHVHLR